MIISLAIALALGGCQPKGTLQSAGGGMDPSMAWTFAELQPATPPSDPAELSLGGTRLPVKVVSKTDSGKFTLQMLSHDVVLESEVYDVQTDTFSLTAMGEETVSPSIPLLKSPMHIGDKWTWDGKITSGTSRPAKGVISSRLDKLYLADKQLDAILVEVNLTMDSGGPAPADRRLSFWFVPGKGLVKREFGSGSIRQPIPKE